MSDPTMLFEEPISQIADALRDRRVTSVALAEVAIENHERFGEPLDAYRTWDPMQIRAAAARADSALVRGDDPGPLVGIAVSVKDLYGVAGWPTYAGTPKPLPARWTSEGPIIRSLRQQDAIISGKTHSVEFAIGSLGTSAHCATPRNPWDALSHRVPGGSSSGAGVSLAEGSALFALGSDTAGSVRTPASMTGVVGLKPTVNRWSTDGVVPLSSTIDTPGLMTRSVADAVYVFAALDAEVASGRSTFLAETEAVKIAGLRFGVADEFFWRDCSPGVAEAVASGVEKLDRAGAVISERIIPFAADAFEFAQTGGVASSEFAQFFSTEIPEFEAFLSPAVASRLAAGRAMSREEYERRLSLLSSWYASAASIFDGIDAILTPTCPNTPPILSDIANPDAYRHQTMLALRNTCVVNQSGCCAITLPVGLDAIGMPVGLQIIAPGGSDSRLIAIARAVEKVLGEPRTRLGNSPLGRSQCHYFSGVHTH